MTFDLEDAKKRGAVTKSGHKVRILCSDRAGKCYPLIGLITYESGEDVWYGSLDGRCSWPDRGMDLQNLPREVTVWVAETEFGERRLFPDKGQAEFWCYYERSCGRAAGYAPVTIKLTR